MQRDNRSGKRDLLEYIDSNQLRESHIPKDYTEAEIGNAVAQLNPRTFPHLNTGEPVPDELKKYNITQLNYFRVLAHQYKLIKPVTPFNVVEGVTSRKGKLTPEVTPDGNGVLRVTVNNNTVDLPISRGVIDPTPLKSANVEVKPFNQGKYRIATLLSLMFDCVEGNAKAVPISKSANEVFRISDVVMEGAPKLTLEQNLTNYIQNEFDDQKVSCKGVKFAELLYGKFVEPRHGGGGYNILCKNIVGVMARNKTNQSYLAAADGVMIFNAPTMRFTKKINGEPFEFTKKIGSLAQLLYTMDAARNIRGENSGERGGIARNAYMLYDVEPMWAEITYWATEMGALQLPKRVRLLADVSATNKIREVLIALRLIHYDGEIIFLNDYPLSSVAKKRNEMFVVNGADYKIRQLSTKEFEADDSLVLDLRAISYKEPTIADTIAKMQAGLADREYNLSRYGKRYILHGPIMENMMVKMDVYSGVRIHNGVGFYLCGHKIDNKNVIPSGQSRGHFFYCGIAANIARAFRVYMVRHTHELMGMMGCKLSVSPVAIFTMCSEEFEETQEELEFDAIKIIDDNGTSNLPPLVRDDAPEEEIDFDGQK